MLRPVPSHGSPSWPPSQLHVIRRWPNVGSVILAHFIPMVFEHMFVYATGHARLGSPRPHSDPPDRRPAGALRRAARRRPPTIREAAAHVEPYLRVDGTKAWSLMQLERYLCPDAYGRVRGGYIARRRPRSTGAGSR
jgi:hypothetical protein